MRNLTKRLNVALLVCCMVLSLTACAQSDSSNVEEPSASSTATVPESASESGPTNYSASAEGYGTVSVTITVDNDIVTAIAINAPDESEGIGASAVANAFQPAFDQKVGTSLSELTFDDVDAVSGATLTSGGVLSAAKGALALAMGGTAKSMTAGTYTASALGYKDMPGKISNGTLAVTVNVSDSEILSIDVDFARDENGNILEGNGASLTENPMYSDVFDTEEAKYAYIQTTNFGGFALDILVDRVLDAQTVSVDSVSGATFTSAGFLSAVSDCLKQANASEDFFLSCPTVEKAETLDYDVVVVGAGCAGLSAAASAQEAGANVLLLEKQDFVGGTTASSNAATRVTNSQLFLSATSGMGEDLVGSTDQQELNAYTAARAEDSSAYTSLTWFWYNETKKNNYLGWYDINLINYIAKNGGYVMDWLMDEVGVPYSLDKITDLATARSHRPYEVGSDPFGNGSRPLLGYMRAYGLTSNLQTFFENKGGTLSLNTRATKLLTDADGNVVGVEAVKTVYDGATKIQTSYIINAKSVVLATGGVDNNSEICADLAPQIQYTNSLGARSGDTGDGITMAYYDTDVNAAVQFNGYGPTAGTSGIRNTDALKALNVATTINYTTDLKVSLQGKIIDFTGYDQDASIVALWNDALYNAKFELPTGVWFALVPASALDETALASANDIAAAGTDSVYKADTLDDLLDILKQQQMDTDALKATIDQWNASADVDAAQKLDGSGPFYAITIVPSTNGSFGGLKTNDSFQVLRLKSDSKTYTDTLTVPDGNYIYDDFRTVKYATYDFWSTVDESQVYEPISGLYAAGEVANSEFYGTIYPSAGTSVGVGVTMGRAAGLSAAADALDGSYDYAYAIHSKALITCEDSGITFGPYYSFSGTLKTDGAAVTVKIAPLTGVTPGDNAVITAGSSVYGSADFDENGVLTISLPVASGVTTSIITIDWDGDGTQYQNTSYIMDFSGIVLE